MIHPSATHRGAPFLGRAREMGILTHLIRDGLESSWSRIDVVGPHGIGRRRLIAEALRNGPDAEWIHLAPADAQADVRTWIREDLLDLLDGYPELAAPSWAYHVLSRVAPVLGRRAALPARSREALAGPEWPELLGSALGEIVAALTGRSRVIVDVGLWPESGDDARVLRRLVDHLALPGAVVLGAAGPADPNAEADAIHRLEIQPLRGPHVHALVDHWAGETVPAGLADWLHRTTGGHPLFIHEIVRWLEELGHVQVEDEAGRVRFLDPVGSLPLPFNLASVLSTRYQRLPAHAQQLLRLLTEFPGGIEREAVRQRVGDDETEEEAFSILRRREFLRRRTWRRPLAATSPLWRQAVARPPRGIPRARTVSYPVEIPREERRRSRAPLARALRSIHDLREQLVRAPDEAGPHDPASPPASLDPRAEIPRLVRIARGRPGPAWGGVRGRVAVVAALWRRRDGRTDLAGRWVRWGRRHLDPGLQAGLRRALGRIELEILEERNHPVAADRLRAGLLEEAVGAGHLVTAAALRVSVAEGRRRLGRFGEAADRAERAERELRTMGRRRARTARAVRLNALLDARRIAEARAVLERSGRPSGSEDEVVRARIEALERVPPLTTPNEPETGGLGSGLDAAARWRAGVKAGARARRALDEGNVDELERILDRVDGDLRESGLLGILADLQEIRFWANLQQGRRTEAERTLDQLLETLGALAVPSRTHFLAEALRLSPAVAMPSFQSRLRPLLLEPPPTAPAVPAVRIRLFGWSRLEQGTSVWPMSLWPEWWTELLLAVVQGHALGEDAVSRGVIRERLDATEDRPAASLETILSMANDRLRGIEPLAGGLVLEGDRIRLARRGLDCDLLSFLEQPDARWPDVTGGYLPGRSDPETDAVRSRVLQVVREVRDRVDRRRGAEIHRAWMEGPNRILESARGLSSESAPRVEPSTPPA